MNFTANMKIAHRLSLGFGIAILALLILSGVAILGIGQLKDNLSQIVEINNPEAAAANRMVDSAQEMRVQYRQYIVDPEPANQRQAFERMQTAQANFNKAEADLVKLFDKYAAFTSTKEKELMAQISSQRQTVVESPRLY